MKADVFVDNNPGNLRQGIGWTGEIGANMTRGDRNGYAVFDSLKNGTRAMFYNLHTYFTKHGVRDLKGVVHLWCRGTPHAEAVYYNFIVKEAKLAAFGGADMKLPWDKNIIIDIVIAMAKMEHSVVLSESMCLAAWASLPVRVQKPFLPK